MRLVNDDGEAPTPLLVPDLVEDERELLYRRDDDLLAALDKRAEVGRAFYQLIGLRKDAAGVFDSIIVVTDRRILDRQICDTIKQFAQVGATVGHAIASTWN